MKMHYCTCQINLSGQNYHTVQILATEPMSWPEVQLMMALHGEENVFDINPVATHDTNPVAEKQRLQAKYRTNAKVVEQVFPGRSPRMEMLMPAQSDDQPSADEYGVPQTELEDDAPEGGLEPPIGPAVFKPVPTRRPFPAEG